MKLSFEAAVLGCENEIPVAASAAVVSPVWHCGVVAQYRVECHIGFVAITEIFAPGIDFLLAGGVPGHLAAEGISLLFPAMGARFHLRFQVIGLSLHAFALEVGQNLEEDVAFHL